MNTRSRDAFRASLAKLDAALGQSGNAVADDVTDLPRRVRRRVGPNVVPDPRELDVLPDASNVSRRVAPQQVSSPVGPSALADAKNNAVEDDGAGVGGGGGGGSGAETIELTDINNIPANNARVVPEIAADVRNEAEGANVVGRAVGAAGADAADAAAVDTAVALAPAAAVEASPAGMALTAGLMVVSMAPNVWHSLFGNDGTAPAPKPVQPLDDNWSGRGFV